jgi:methylmalonyl-CoA/ethylmalonyl-CoA epimerase
MADTTSQGIGTTVVTQIGIVVRDIEMTSRAWADVFGVPVPPVIVTDGLDKAHTEYEGKPSTAQAKLSFLHFGQVSIEFIEPIGAPSTWKDFLDTHGEGVHHIAFEIKGMNEQIAYLTGKDVPLIQRGDYTGGRYAYLNGEPRLTVLLELLENFR